MDVLLGCITCDDALGGSNWGDEMCHQNLVLTQLNTMATTGTLTYRWD